MPWRPRARCRTARQRARTSQTFAGTIRGRQRPLPASLCGPYADAGRTPSNRHAETPFYAAGAAPFRMLRNEGVAMLDLIMLALGLGFFAVAVAYAFLCDRL